MPSQLVSGGHRGGDELVPRHKGKGGGDFLGVRIGCVDPEEPISEVKGAELGASWFLGILRIWNTDIKKNISKNSQCQDYIHES